MKLSKTTYTAVAAAVAIGMATAAANADVVAPAYSSAGLTTSSLYLLVWNPTTSFTDVVNLGYAYNDVSQASGNFQPNSATSPFSVASDPTGAAGNVLQLTFPGAVPGFVGGAGTQYMVVGSNAQTVTSGANAEALEITGSSATTLTHGSLNTIGMNVGSETSLVTSSPAVDTTGTATYAGSGPVVKNFSFGDTGNDFGGDVGSALPFYDIVSTGRTTISNTQYQNTAGDAFWFLSSSGVLSYNLPSGGSPVPLPAAVWLLASGIAGLGAIGRRRRNGMGVQAV